MKTEMEKNQALRARLDSMPIAAKRGGAREGAGRPPTEDPARHTVKTRLTDLQYVKWQEIGASKWLKRQLDELERQIDEELNKSTKTPADK